MAVARHRHQFHLRHSAHVAHCRCLGQRHRRDESSRWPTRIATGCLRESRAASTAACSCWPSAGESQSRTIVEHVARRNSPSVEPRKRRPRAHQRCPRRTGGGGGLMHAVVQSVLLRHPPTTAFTINLELQLANGSGSWKASNVSGYLGLTFEIRVSVGSTGVSVTRLYAGGRTRRYAGHHFGAIRGQRHSRDRKGGT